MMLFICMWLQKEPFSIYNPSLCFLVIVAEYINFDVYMGTSILSLTISSTATNSSNC